MEKTIGFYVAEFHFPSEMTFMLSELHVNLIMYINTCIVVGLKDLGESCVLKNEFSDVQFGIIYDYQVVKAGGRLKLVVNQKEMSANLYFSL